MNKLEYDIQSILFRYVMDCHRTNKAPHNLGKIAVKIMEKHDQLRYQNQLQIESNEDNVISIRKN